MNKEKLELMCVAAGMTPQWRGPSTDGELFISDGFSARPGDTFGKFGATNEEFPFGAYLTLWSFADGEDRIKGGGALLFDAFHDPGWDAETKKRARVNKARQEGETFMAARGT